MASQASSHDYAHKPLTSPRSFRVLELLPSLRYESAVSCEIREACLDDNVEYEALSYVWGKKQPDYSVSVGTETLAVTPNCLSALRHLRREFRRRVLWVDAICIDQRESQPSIRERNHQVELMGKIYSEAHTVLVSLPTYKVITILKQINCVEVLPFNPLRKWLCRALVDMWNGWLNYCSVYEAINWILWTDWWYRAWTFQEQALARRCVILSGRRSISMRDLMQAIHSTSLLGSRVAEPMKELTPIAFASHNRLNYETYKQQEAARSAQNPRLLAKTVLTGALFMEATLPVDRIYALYSMLVMYGLPLPEPDYNKAFEVVYEETVWAWIHQWQDLSILQTAASPEYVQNLPSWVPAYHLSRKGDWARPTFDDFSWGSSKTADNLYAGHAEAKHSPGMLTVKGKYIGKVAYCWYSLSFNYMRGDKATEWMPLCNYLSVNSSRDSLGYDGRLRELFESIVFPRGSEYINDDDFSAFKMCFDNMVNTDPNGFQGFDDMADDRMKKILREVFSCTLCILDNGMMGKVDTWYEVGDEVFLLRGADCPFVLRRDGENYRLVGPAYVHLLYQEQPWRFDGDDVRDITLV